MEPLGFRMQDKEFGSTEMSLHALVARAREQLLGTGSSKATVGVDVAQPGKDDG